MLQHDSHPVQLSIPFSQTCSRARFRPVSLWYAPNPCGAKQSLSFLALFVMSPALLRAECGMDKPFKIYVQTSYHANNVAVPSAGCKTNDTPCTTSGTIY